MKFYFTDRKTFLRSRANLENARILLIETSDNQSYEYINWLRTLKFFTKAPKQFRIKQKYPDFADLLSSSLECDENVAFYLDTNKYTIVPLMWLNIL